jgi:hypothetical protein
VGYRVPSRDQHFQDKSPKRILALDGGGIRGILSLGILKSLEDRLRTRHGGDPAFRLAHYFDLVAGTSTGAIIAAALAQGMAVDEIREHYLELGTKVFERSWFRQGLVRAKYDAAALSRELKRILGEEATLGGAALRTGLLVVLKRLDTGSPWPVANNPSDPYYGGDAETGTIANAEYPLWKVVRASTAAPHYFEPEPIVISRRKGSPTVAGNFVDGGVSPHNNPSLQALQYATLSGFGVEWPLGHEQLLLVSVGTGRRAPEIDPSIIAGKHAVKSVLSIMDDCADLVETMLQWLSSSRTAREIDSAVGSLAGDLLGGRELLSYARFDVTLVPDVVNRLLGRELPEATVLKLSAMDAPENLSLLDEIGRAAGEDLVEDGDLPKAFDLPPS